MLGLTDALSADVHAVLDRRLAATSDAPLAIALSGGGDSRALALIAADWAAAHGRRLAILTVDHGLNPASAAWTAQCADLARRLDAAFHALAWAGEKPAHGLPAAARLARHRLLADAARSLGARVILLGHTASDLAEAAAMRAEGSTTPSPREWSPSPVWPEGRGLFLLRPMLAQTRQDLRDWLVARGETWIDDPSNDDLRFARPRARASGASLGAPPSELSPDLADLARAATVDAAGVIALPRASLSPRLIAAASLCAAGTSRPPRADRQARIEMLLGADRPLVATLAGARIETDGDRVLFMREPGEFERHPDAALMLAPGETAVWDGRFEIAAARAAVIAPLAGHAAQLPAAQRRALRAIAPKARAAMPVLLDGHDAYCPLLEEVASLTIHSLIHDRLLAACGAVEREP